MDHRIDGCEHRLIRDGVAVIDGNRIKHVGKSYTGNVEKWIMADYHVVTKFHLRPLSRGYLT